MDKQELKQAREDIAKWLHSYTVGVRQQYINSLQQLLWEELSPNTQEGWREEANQILTIKLGSRTLKEWIELYEKGKLRIEADDQSLPEVPLFSARECPICGGNLKGVPSDWGEGGGLYCEGECDCYVNTDTYREKWVHNAGFVKVRPKKE